MRKVALLVLAFLAVLVSVLILMKDGDIELPDSENGATDAADSARSQDKPTTHYGSDSVFSNGDGVGASANSHENVTGPPVGSDDSARMVDELVESRTENLLKPPFMGEGGAPPIPSPIDRSVASLARDIQRAAGPETAEHAKRLLASDEAGVGLVGAALLPDQPAWVLDDALLDTLSGHQDPAVPLLALQGLVDAGRTEDADRLEERMLARFRSDPEAFVNLPTRSLPGVALRGWIAASDALLEEEQRVDSLMGIAVTDTADYSARMHALLALRETMPFEDYRAFVDAEAGEARREAQPDVWQLGVERLAERLAGPVAVHEGPRTMSVDDIQVMTARELPTMYEDLALALETMIAGGNALFGEGVGDALQQTVQRASDLPASDAELRALQRITTQIPQINETDLTGLVPPPPPLHE